jgi:hypothetical protein
MNATKDKALGSQVPVQTQVENAHKWLKLLGGIVTNVTIITSFFSVIIGAIVIITYLSNFAIPISPLGTFGASSFQIFVFFFIALLGSGVSIFLVPLYATYLAPHEIRDSLQELFTQRNIPPNTLRTRRVINFLKEYLIFYSPTLSLTWCMPIIVYLDKTEKIYPSVILFVILSSFSVSAWRLSKKLESRSKLESLWALLMFNWVTIMWVLFVEIIMLNSWQYIFGESIVPTWKAVIEVMFVSVLVTSCHVAMAWARASIRRLAIAVVVLLVTFAFYPGYAAIGAAALRAAQLGGGTRISYTVVDPRATTPEPTSGCLVLATTSHVLIGELDDNSCPSLMRFWGITASEAKPRPVREFSRSEIKISEVHDR